MIVQEEPKYQRLATWNIFAMKPPDIATLLTRGTEMGGKDSNDISNIPCCIVVTNLPSIKYNIVLFWQLHYGTFPVTSETKCQITPFYACPLSFKSTLFIHNSTLHPYFAQPAHIGSDNHTYPSLITENQQTFAVWQDKIFVFSVWYIRFGTVPYSTYAYPTRVPAYIHKSSDEVFRYRHG